MVRELDAGPFAYQSRFPIDKQGTALTLSAQSVKAGVPLISELLETASKESPTQSRRLARIFRVTLLRKRGTPGRVARLGPPRTRDRHLRGGVRLRPLRLPWGHPKTRLNGRELSVLKASLLGERCSGRHGR